MDKTNYDPQSVRHSRLAAGYETQEDAAKALGVNRRFVSQAETTRKTKASFTLLSRMATLYRCSVKEWLLDTPPTHRFHLPKKVTSQVK